MLQQPQNLCIHGFIGALSRRRKINLNGIRLADCVVMRFMTVSLPFFAQLFYGVVIPNLRIVGVLEKGEATSHGVYMRG